MKTINAIIIDDEEDGREALKMAITNYCKAIVLLDVCDSAKSGIIAIQKLKPDVIFLDIQMPHMSGFDMLQQLDVIDFHIIFVTAYDRYAIKAIKFSALDYLLKPIDIDELQTTVKKLLSNDNLPKPDHNLEALYSNVQEPNSHLKKIAVPTLESLILINTDHIIFCKANGSYTDLYLTNNRHMLISKALADFEQLLTDDRFCRTHRSFFININHVQEYFRGEGGYVKLTEDHLADVSRRKKEQFLKQLQTL